MYTNVYIYLIRFYEGKLSQQCVWVGYKMPVQTLK